MKAEDYILSFTKSLGPGQRLAKCHLDLPNATLKNNSAQSKPFKRNTTELLKLWNQKLGDDDDVNVNT